MKRWVVGAGLIVVGCLLAAEPAHAQVRLGVQANFADEFDLGVGVRAQRHLAGLLEEDSPMSVLTGVVSLDYYFPDCDPLDCHYFELNGNVLYPVDLGEGWAPYVGGGLHLGRLGVENTSANAAQAQLETGGALVARDQSDTQIGLNAVGGAIFDLGGLDAFGEMKLGLGGWEHFVIRFGILLGRE